MVQGELQLSLPLFKVQMILAWGDLGAQSCATDELGEHISLLWHGVFVARTVKPAQSLQYFITFLGVMNQNFSTAYAKFLSAPKPVKKCTVGNYMIYAFLHVMWREELTRVFSHLWGRTWEVGCSKKKILETSWIWTRMNCIWVNGSWLMLQSQKLLDRPEINMNSSFLVLVQTSSLIWWCRFAGVPCKFSFAF